MTEQRFYTTVIRDSRGVRKVGFLLGPFETEATARRHIPAARREAEAVDPRCAFDFFGTSRVEGAPLPVGVLNDRCGL